jgi:hypothetical protein
MTQEQYSKTEKSLFKKLNTPTKIQDFLAFEIRHNPASDGVECRSPREVLKFGKAHCMEGALLGAAVLEFHGQKPLLMDLRSTVEDLDHVVALFRQGQFWGAISKTNHVGLRYREPVYKSVRELAMSYFHEYFLDNGKKTLREYSVPFDANEINFLNPVSGPRAVSDHQRYQKKGLLPKNSSASSTNGVNWRTTEKDLIELPDYLDRAEHFKILDKRQLRSLRKADPIEIQAGKLIQWKK